MYQNEVKNTTPAADREIRELERVFRNLTEAAEHSEKLTEELTLRLQCLLSTQTKAMEPRPKVQQYSAPLTMELDTRIETILRANGRMMAILETLVI